MRYLPEYFQRQIALCGFLTVVALPIGCGTSKPAGNDNEGEVASCTEPSNPFSEGTGHYAGYEWAEKNGSGDCNGSSQFHLAQPVNLAGAVNPQMTFWSYRYFYTTTDYAYVEASTDNVSWTTIASHPASPTGHSSTLLSGIQWLAIMTNR